MNDKKVRALPRYQTKKTGTTGWKNGTLFKPQWSMVNLFKPLWSMV